MATVMPRLEGVRLVVYSFHVDTAVAHTLPLATGCFWPEVVSSIRQEPPKSWLLPKAKTGQKRVSSVYQVGGGSGNVIQTPKKWN